MHLNHTITLALCLVMSIPALARQTKEPKVKFGDVKPEDFTKDYATLDSAAEAVYLYEAGSVKHEGNNEGWFSIIYKLHRRILLISKNSFDDLSKVKINLYENGTAKEKIEDLQAATYNLENGRVVQTRLDKNSTFKDKDGDYQVVKFTFPDIKEGSIIEYTYTINSPFYRYIPSWAFQGGYPELWSEFTIEQPEFFEFVVLNQGYLRPVIDTSVVETNIFNVIIPNGSGQSESVALRGRVVKHTWAFKDIPALKEESFVTTLDNHIEKIQFQFSAEQLPEQQRKTYLHSWYEMADQLMKDEDFGADLSKENGWLKDDVKAAVNGETDAVGRARKIYEYVRDNYTCTDNSAKYLSQTLKKTQQSKKGNVVDINMLLIAMLKIAGCTADPVLLSTRGHGKTYDMYPIMDRFNYLIARVTINDKLYLLDASDPVLGFGHLSGACYNGNARVIAPDPALINLDADSLKEVSITSFFVTNDGDGKLSGTYKTTFGPIGSENLREKMKKSNAETYFKDIKKAYPFEVSMSNTAIDSLDEKEMPVSVQYDIGFNTGEDIIYFPPMMTADAYKENPFKATQRFYPVEIPYCIDEVYILNMEVPSGYRVDELPKPARVSLNDGEGMFEYLIQASSSSVQLRCRTRLNKATFEPEDYETLRNFFAFIVEKENEQIVFKKI
ncbi:transglutaminase domain-containing protein [Parafilimonas sp.]|uniref:DUF3857 domain-containing protein n=1 Tax=Parafilimonas sp. TaxID=1969739 RepID=UPI0039E43CE8